MLAHLRKHREQEQPPSLARSLDRQRLYTGYPALERLVPTGRGLSEMLTRRDCCLTYQHKTTNIFFAWMTGTCTKIVRLTLRVNKECAYIQTHRCSDSLHRAWRLTVAFLSW